MKNNKPKTIEEFEDEFWYKFSKDDFASSQIMYAVIGTVRTYLESVLEYLEMKYVAHDVFEEMEVAVYNGAVDILNQKIAEIRGEEIEE